jgi:hypothetical protein
MRVQTDPQDHLYSITACQPPLIHLCTVQMRGEPLPMLEVYTNIVTRCPLPSHDGLGIASVCKYENISILA